MLSNDLLSTVLVQTFNDQCGKWQCKKPEAEQKAMLISFHSSVDYDKEEGYRFVEILIYGLMNYVSVYVRTRWTVISLDDIDVDDEGEAFVKKGKDYQKGSSDWKLVGHHDSGWRSAIEDILKEYGSSLRGFSGPGFYSLVPLPKELIED